VVKDRHSQQVTHLAEAGCELDVLAGGARIAAGVIVSEDEGGSLIHDGVAEDLAGVHLNAREGADVDDPTGDDSVANVQVEHDEMLAVGFPDADELSEDVGRAVELSAEGAAGRAAHGPVGHGLDLGHVVDCWLSILVAHRCLLRSGLGHPGASGPVPRGRGAPRTTTRSAEEAERGETPERARAQSERVPQPGTKERPRGAELVTERRSRSSTKTGTCYGQLALGSSRVRLISWNTAGRISKARQQVAALGLRAPDLVALQEVRIGAEPVLRAELKGLGFEHIVGSRDFSGAELPVRGPRQYGLLLASRWPLTAISPGNFVVPWPERVLSAVVGTPAGPVEVHTTGIPPGVTNGWTKVEMLEGIYRGLARTAPLPRILCGDFNTPKAEREDGEVITGGQVITRSGSGRLRPTRSDRSGRKDTGERWTAPNATSCWAFSCSTSTTCSALCTGMVGPPPAGTGDLENGRSGSVLTTSSRQRYWPSPRATIWMASGSRD
jgi:hypothetical protein